LIKFILAIVAMIFVGLAAYVYMNPKETHVPVAKVVHKTETSIVKREAPLVEKKTISAITKVVSGKSELNVSSSLDRNTKTIEDFNDTELLISEDALVYDPNIDTTSSHELMTDEDFEKAESNMLHEDVIPEQVEDSDKEILELQKLGD